MDRACIEQTCCAATRRHAAGHLRDLELYLRLLEEFDFACIRAVTAAIDVRRDGSSISSSLTGLDRERLAQDYERLYCAFPVPHRATIEEARAVRYEHVRLRSQAPHPVIPLTSPPLWEYPSLRAAAGPPEPDPAQIEGSQSSVAAASVAIAGAFPEIEVEVDVERLQTWRARLQRDRAFFEAAREQLAADQREISRLRAVEPTKELRASVRHWASRAELLADQLRAARAEARALNVRADTVEAEIEAMRRSRSWRLTRPLRLGARQLLRRRRSSI
jgi:hypothetical protein